MDIKEYTEEIKRTAPLLGTDFADQLHMAIGISTEAGELLDTFKKAFAYGKELDLINIAEECGDLAWYLLNLCRMLGLDFEKVLETNVDKLRVRYPEKFTQENAINRNLQDERKVLEGKSTLEFLE